MENNPDYVNIKIQLNNDFWIKYRALVVKKGVPWQNPFGR